MNLELIKEKQLNIFQDKCVVARGGFLPFENSIRTTRGPKILTLKIFIFFLNAFKD